MPILKGLSFPISFNKRGSLSQSEGLTKIKENLKALVLTAVGERRMNPHVGASGYEYMFRNLDESEISILKYQIRMGLEAGESRVTIVNVTITQPDQEGQLLIDISFRVDTTNEFENLTFYI